VCLSDDKGNMAKYCDTTALIVDSDDYNDKKQVKEQIQALSDKGCNVLGVIINE
jgi:Mrp family chromosome partitioning ATPase